MMRDDEREAVLRVLETVSEEAGAPSARSLSSHPAVPFENTGFHTLPYGRTPVRLAYSLLATVSQKWSDAPQGVSRRREEGPEATDI